MSLAEYDDDDEGDGLFFALVVGVAYFAIQFWRYRQAATYGGGVFQPVPPPADVGQGILNILVPLQLSPGGREFIKQNEGFTARPNRTGDIGYGHHIQPGDNIVPPITRAEAETLFAGDVAAAERTVSNALLVQVSQSQFDSLVDLAFNIGAGAFLGSTLLRRLNGGDFAGAAGEFSQWVHSGGVVNSNLVDRRALDLDLFQGG